MILAKEICSKTVILMETKLPVTKAMLLMVLNATFICPMRMTLPKFPKTKVYLTMEKKVEIAKDKGGKDNSSLHCGGQQLILNLTTFCSQNCCHQCILRVIIAKLSGTK